MNLLALLCLALIHMLVDLYSQFVTPLWPRLERDFGLQPWAMTLMIAAWTTAASISQPFFGYCGDRFGCRWLVGLGPALAVVCISSVGLAGGPASLMLLLIVGGLGIGAFHPEAAVGVAEAAGQRMTGALAIFICGGMLGLGCGPLLSGFLTERYGMASLSWTMLPSLLILSLLLFLPRPVTNHVHTNNGAGLADIFDGRWLSATLLLTVATLRVVPAIGIPLALAFSLHNQDVGEAEIGVVQSLFLLSGGIGTLLCPTLVRRGREVTALVQSTLLAAVCLMLVYWNRPLAYYAGLIGSGFLLQGAMPVLVSYSQRLLPRGRRMAASITMGTSWGLGGIMVAGLQGYFQSIGYIDGMILALVPFTLLAAFGAALLPSVAALGEPTAIPSISTVEPSGSIVQA